MKEKSFIPNQVSISIQFFPKLLLCGFLFFSPVESNTIEPDHPVYTFLKRMNIKFDLDGVYLNSLPLHKKEIQHALKKIMNSHGSMTPWEMGELKKYRYEFFPDLRRETSYLVYKKDERELEGELQYYTVLKYQDSLPRNQLYAFGTVGAKIEGQLNSKLSFYSSVTFGQERVLKDDSRFTEHYSAQRGLPINTPDKADGPARLYSLGTFDGFRSIISFSNPGMYLDFGNDWNQWGPGIWQHPVISQNSYLWVQDSLDIDSNLTYIGNNHLGQFRRGYTEPGESAPIPQLRGSFTWEFLKYTKFFGRKTGLFHDSISYLTGHRLDFKYGSFSLGLQEILTYSRDRLEWSYVMPLAPLYIVEHLLGDKDNVALGFDIEYTLYNQFRLYSELFLDDLSNPLSLFDDFWGNKYAFTGGVEIPDLILKNSNLQLEYSRVEPWLFSHRTPTGFSNNQLQHFGSLLGSSLPANSHQFQFQWTQFFMFNIIASLHYSFYQHNHNELGSSILNTHEVDDPITKDFLGTDPDTRQDFNINLSYAWRRYAQISILTGYQIAQNWRSIPGQDLNTWVISTTVKMEY